VFFPTQKTQPLQHKNAVRYLNYFTLYPHWKKLILVMRYKSATQVKPDKRYIDRLKKEIINDQAAEEKAQLFSSPVKLV